MSGSYAMRGFIQEEVYECSVCGVCWRLSEGGECLCCDKDRLMEGLVGLIEELTERIDRLRPNTKGPK